MQLLSASASQKDGVVTITLANLDMAQSQTVALCGIGGDLSGEGTVTVLHSPDPRDHNTFENPTKIKTVSERKRFSAQDILTIPAACVAAITIRKEG